VTLLRPKDPGTVVTSAVCGAANYECEVAGIEIVLNAAYHARGLTWRWRKTPPFRGCGSPPLFRRSIAADRRALAAGRISSISAAGTNRIPFDAIGSASPASRRSACGATQSGRTARRASAEWRYRLAAVEPAARRTMPTACEGTDSRRRVERAAATSTTRTAERRLVTGDHDHRRLVAATHPTNAVNHANRGLRTWFHRLNSKNARRRDRIDAPLGNSSPIRTAPMRFRDRFPL